LAAELGDPAGVAAIEPVVEASWIAIGSGSMAVAT
jgi:hypothetical protein